MLQITLQFVPDGDQKRARTLGFAKIGKDSGGELADYHVEVFGDDLYKMTATLKDYPRHSEPVWFMAARAICLALYGEDTLPNFPKPISEQVPVLGNGDKYIRVSDIPEPGRKLFQKRMHGQTQPVIEGEGEYDCHYAFKLTDWLRG